MTTRAVYWNSPLPPRRRSILPAGRMRTLRPAADRPELRISVPSASLPSTVNGSSPRMSNGAAIVSPAAMSWNVPASPATVMRRNGIAWPDWF